MSQVNRLDLLFGTRRTVLLLCAVSLARLTGCGGRETQERRLETALLSQRFTISRFARQSSWSLCTVADSAAAIPRVHCDEPPRPGTQRFDDLSRAIRDSRSWLQSTPTPHALRLRALADLPWIDSDPAAPDRLVSTLDRAAASAPNDAIVLNDLAAAYLTLGERQQRLRPMLAALDAVQRAVARDSLLGTALFNRALILERLYLIGSARTAWTRYLAVERSEAWRHEAELHNARVLERLGSQAWTFSLDSLLARPDTAAMRDVMTRTRQAPQAAREFGLSMLSDWGAAVASGQQARSERILALGRSIAAASDALGSDSTLSFELARIDSFAAAPDRLRTLADGYVQLGDGRRLFQAPKFEEALPVLESAGTRLRSVGSLAAGLAQYYVAASRVSLGDYSGGDRVFQRILAEAGSRQPSLTGRSMLGLGVSQVRRGNYDGASTWYRAALPHLTRARDNQSIGFAYYLLAESLGFTGRTIASHDTSYRAIQTLSLFRGSPQLYQQLSRLAADARGEGLTRASLAITDEILDVANALGRPDLLALALCSRARDRLAVDDADGARRDMEKAEVWAERMPPGRGLDRIRAIVLLTRGVVTRPRDARAALGFLTQAVEGLRRFETDAFLPSALYEAGVTARQVADSMQARAWLEEAIGSIEHQTSRLRTGEDRVAFSETAENVFDTMIGMEIERDRGDLAFDYLERARRVVTVSTSSATPARPVNHECRTPACIGPALPNDLLLVEYVVLRDRIVVWTASRRGWRYRSIAYSRDSLSALIGRLPSELASDHPSTSGALSQLFELLMRPVELELAHAQRLAIVPDRELHRVPFAALWDSRTRRYAVQAYEIRTVPSAEFLLTSLRVQSPRRGDGSTLVVGEPSLDQAAAGGLARLPGAQREARAVAGLYPNGKLVMAQDASRETIMKLLPRYSAFHFAGHAISDVDRPEFSYLALARDSLTDGRLRAWEIARLRLSNMQVVVLSACTTLSPRATRNGTMAGLAYSFLRAGVPATISTLWDVADEATTDLLIGFHRHLASGESVPQALRVAQLEAMKATDAHSRAPQTWAAFTYTGP